MEAGRLRHRVDIQERVVTRDDEGGDVISWLAWATGVPAEIAVTSGREAAMAGVMAAAASTKITIRWRPGVVATMRLLHQGTVYNAAAVLPDPDSGRDFLLILCESGLNDGQ